MVSLCTHVCVCVCARVSVRFGLLSGPGSSDSLLGPKDSPRVASATLDARELLRHFTPDGLPTAELQPLQLLRGQGYTLASIHTTDQLHSCRVLLNTLPVCDTIFSTH